MLKAILVDDEEKSRKNVQLLLQKHCADAVQVLGESDNVNDAFTLITKLKPNLVFLDIEMGQQTGFDLIAKFPQPNFKCIFITAYDQYALKAIKFCALDYILKPIDYKELQQAVAKAKAVLEQPEKENMQNLISILKQPNHKSNKVVIPTAKGFNFIPVEHILYIEAEKGYTFIHCTNNQKVCSTTSLGEYEDLLSEYTFFRTHHSYLINKEFVTGYIKGEGGEVTLTTGSTVPVSKRRKTELMEWLYK
jgi:two-component system LytT family response regulator